MKKIVFFGTGSVARHVLIQTEKKPSFCVDNNEMLWGKTFYDNIMIYSPQILLKEEKDNICIVVTSIFHNEIANQLTSLGFIEDEHFIRYNNATYQEVSDKVYYSQEGEDILLSRIFGERKEGFYVDIGAHHPTRFSNTYMLYKKGRSGINIDPLPGTKKRFDIFRGRDINLEIGISNVEGEMEYFVFNEPALNTFSVDQKEQVLLNCNYKLVKKHRIPVC